MKQIHIHGKSFNEKELSKLVIGGQTGADTIRFVVPRIYAGELDFSSWLWTITYENKEGQGDTAFLTVKPSDVDLDLLYLDWTPSITATQVAGKLECQVIATKTEGDTTRRFSCVPFSVYVEKWLKPEPITQALPTVIEQALELMEYYVNHLDQAISSAEEAKGYAQDASDTLKEVEDIRDSFDANASEKLAEYDNNADAKLKAYNDNDAAKTKAYDLNHDSKIKAYNDNAIEKTSEANTAITNHTNSKKGELDSKTSEEKLEIDSYVEKTSKPAIDTYLNTTVKNAIDTATTSAVKAVGDKADMESGRLETEANEKIQEMNQLLSALTLGESTYEVL